MKNKYSKLKSFGKSLVSPFKFYGNLLKVYISGMDAQYALEPKKHKINRAILTVISPVRFYYGIAKVFHEGRKAQKNTSKLLPKNSETGFQDFVKTL